MLVLGAGVYGQRLVGMLALDPSRMPARWNVVVERIPLAIIAAVIALQTGTTGGSLELDARAAGVAAAAVCAWRRLPLAIIVVVAAGVTAVLRAVG
ncbi:MAG: AzlD domain-containing protein [Actinomycetota bacterium]